MQDIRSLLVFAAVLEHGSMHAAAQALAMTPSAVSQHVARLEAMHQLKLLHRSTRRLTPTDAGLALAAHCAQLQQVLQQTQAALQSLKTEAAGDLHLALTSSLADAPAFQASLQQLQLEYPRIRPVLHFGDGLSDLQQEEIDIAIRGGDHALEAPGLVARHLAAWRWLICASPKYLAQYALVEEPAQLLHHRWLHYAGLSDHWTLHQQRIRPVLEDEASRLPPSQYEPEFVHFHLQMPVSIPCSQLAAVRTLALGGLGLSLQLAGEVESLVRQGLLQVVLPQWRLPQVNLYAVTPHRAQSAKVRAALAVLQQCFAGTGQDAVTQAPKG